MLLTCWSSLILSVLAVSPLTIINDLDRYGNFDHLNILRFGDSLNLNFQELRSPKLIFSNITQVTLKFMFSSNILTIVILDNRLNLEIQMDILQKTLRFNNLSNVIVIAKNFKHLRNIFIEGRARKLLNMLVIINDSKQVYTYSEIGRIRFHKAMSFPKPIKNIHQQKILLLFQNELPAAYSIIEEDVPANYAGFLLRMITEFVNYLNGTFLPLAVFSEGRKMDKSIFFTNNVWDFMGVFETPSARNQNWSILENLQWKSDVLEMFTWRIIVPVPKPIAERRYFLMPFSRLVLMVYVLLGSYAVLFLILQRYFSERKDKVNNDYFGITFRAMLSLSYKFKVEIEPIQVRIVMILLTVLGFMYVAWYSALLGSFVTTFLFEKPLLTLKDIVKSGLKIAISEDDFKLDLNVRQDFPKHIFVRNMSREEFLRAGDHFNTSFGYAMYGDRWKYFFKPKMRFFHDKKFLQTEIVLENYYLQLYLRNDSIYKDQVNTFIHRIRDTGLYFYWTRTAFYDILKLMNIERPLFKPRSRLHVLTLEFYVGTFYIIQVGLICGLIVFVFEILWFKARKNFVLII